MNIPLNDLSHQYRSLKPEIDAAISKVLRRGIFILGPEVAAFEKEFAGFIGTKYSVGVGSGTDALTLGLKALGIKTGDEVIVPTNAYPTAFGVAMSGAKPKLVDCGKDGNIDPEQLKKVITVKTKAVVVVHLYGNPADLNKIAILLHRYIAKNKTQIFLVEDCAQAHGATIKLTNWRKIGSIGDIGCFSFYPTKNLGAFGDGGVIVTNNKDIASRLKRLRMYGEVSCYQSVETAGVSRLDELQAAVLRIKLRHLERWNKRRAEIAGYYRRELIILSRVLPRVFPLRASPAHYRSVYHLFVIRTSRRNQLKEYLAKKGIATGIHYPTPVHLQPAFKSLGYKRGDFPVAEKLSREILSLPIFPELTDAEVEYVVATVKKFFRVL